MMERPMGFASRRGAELVEMALVLPLLLVLVFGMVDFGFLIYDKAIVTYAAREGARAGVVFAPDPGVLPGVQRPTTAQIKQVVLDRCSTWLISFGSHVVNTDDITVTGAQGASGTELTVTLTFPHQFVIIDHLIPALGNITLRSTSRMRIE